MPRVLLTSPDRQAELRLDPAPDDQWWRLHHAATADHPAWYASFGARTPVELIAAVLDALTDPVTPKPATPDPWEPARQTGWAWSPGTCISPDGIAEIEHFTDHGSSWFITAALSNDPENQLWQARFDGTTPTYLISTFTRALADPSPLIRDPSASRPASAGTHSFAPSNCPSRRSPSRWSTARPPSPSVAPRRQRRHRPRHRCHSRAEPADRPAPSDSPFGTASCLSPPPTPPTATT